MREITTIKSKSVASNEVAVQDKITDGDKFATDILEDVRISRKVIRILILNIWVATKIINIINENIIIYDFSVEKR